MTRIINISVFLFLCCSAMNTSAQESASKDSIPAHKVMLIPYDSRYYLSDADRDILEQSHMEAERFRSSFRMSVDRHVQRAIRGSYDCISLLNDTADALEETMYMVLGRTGYKYEKAIPITPKPPAGPVDEFKRKNSSSKEFEDSKTATIYIPVEKDALYMRAIVSKPEDLFARLNREYQADIFVFLTQFEIKTNYKSCLDIANKIYRREVMVHFTIYDKQGRLIAGSYATSYFPSDSNNANTIIGNCFPEIAGYIAGCLP